MAVLTQTVTTETAINWEELAQKIKDNTSGLKVGDIITEETLDGEEMDLVVVDMGPGWARFESKDCLPVEVAYNQNNELNCDKRRKTRTTIPETESRRAEKEAGNNREI